MEILKAKDGGYLTQNKEVEISERMFVTEVCGVRIDKASWRAATAEEIREKEEYDKAEAERLAQRNQLEDNGL